jgi:hypothetical protein
MLDALFYRTRRIHWYKYKVNGAKTVERMAKSAGLGHFYYHPLQTSLFLQRYMPDKKSRPVVLNHQAQ